MRTSTFLSILPLLATALAAPQARLHPRAHVNKREYAVSEGTGAGAGAYSYSSPAQPETATGYESMKTVNLHESTGMSGESGHEAMAAEQPAAHEMVESPAAQSHEAPPPAETTVEAAHEAAPPAETSAPAYQAATSPYDLDSCVQMCQAQFGGGHDAMMGMDKMGGEAPPPTGTEGAAPATHTIIVAPTKGVLRFVPFATNANPGDKIVYFWGAGPHSSTLSLGTSVCNKSTEAGAFDSGKLNASATFEATYNGDPTKPQFHYCTVGQHCVGGMFGVINPPTTNVSNGLTDSALKPTPTEAAAEAGSTAGSGSGGCSGNSMDCWVERWMASSPEAQATGKAVKEACASSPESWAWGGNLDMSSLETESMPRKTMIENVMYTRLMLASNPTMINGTTSTDYVSVPELNTFVAEKTGIESTGEAYGGEADAGASTAPSASASAPAAGESGDSSSAEAAQDATPSGGAFSRTTFAASSTLIGLFGVVLAWAL